MDEGIFLAVDEYIKERVGLEDAVLREVKESCRRSSMPDAEISANQGKFLQILARACGARRILELGTSVGYSSIWLARALPSDGRLLSVEFDEGNYKIAVENIRRAKLESVVELRRGKALDVLRDLLAEGEGGFDFIFIDADKPPYLEYLEYSIELSRKGTIIVMDNVVRNGEVLNGNSEDERVRGVQRLNDHLKGRKEADFTILQTVGGKSHDGMAVGIVN
jgi:caffeoyl-CoA O-methyltransferase